MISFSTLRILSLLVVHDAKQIVEKSTYGKRDFILIIKTSLKTFRNEND
jgi:hypothetical protein